MSCEVRTSSVYSRLYYIQMMFTLLSRVKLSRNRSWRPMSCEVRTSSVYRRVKLSPQQVVEIHRCVSCEVRTSYIYFVTYTTVVCGMCVTNNYVDSDWIPDLFTMEIYSCTHYNYIEHYSPDSFSGSTDGTVLRRRLTWKTDLFCFQTLTDDDSLAHWRRLTNSFRCRRLTNC
jgi:hypothetical protein